MRKLRKTILIFGLLSVAAVLILVVSLYTNQAPITQGEIDYNVIYKGELALDVYEPTQEIHELRPVLIYFHGGAWVGGNKVTVNNNRFHGAFNALREQGYLIISPEYTLAEREKSPFPACIDDGLDVMKWVEQHAEQYNMDLENVGLLGESAGGHIAMMVAMANEGQFSEPYTMDIQYVVDVYGPTDLQGLYESSEIRKEMKAHLERLPESLQERLDLAQYLYGFNPETDSQKAVEFASRHSPITYIAEDAPPILMIHGDADRVVPFSQSVLLKEKLDALGVVHEMHALKGSDHAFLGASEEQKDSIQSWIIDFVGRHYR